MTLVKHYNNTTELCVDENGEIVNFLSHLLLT